MSTTKSGAKGPSQPQPKASALLTLMQLQPLVPPRFPTLSELLRPPVVSKSSSPPSGLFCSLVGVPEVMFDDLLRDPKKYEDGVAELLQEMIQGSKTIGSLSSSEMRLLDRATLDLNRSSSAKPSESSKPSTPEKPKTSSESEGTETTSDELIPDGSLVPEWFR